MTTNETGGIQVIARAASILRALELSPDGLSLAELSTRVGLARSTVQRIVGALTTEQILLSGSPRGRVKLGPALIRLASASDVSTDRLARPVIQRLSRDLGETVDLSVLQGSTAIFVDQMVGNHRLVAMSAIGEGFPVHCTANGKALLACVSQDRRATILSRRLDKLTPQTIISRSALEQQIAEYYVSGVAWDLEEHSEGICAAGAAFIDPLGRDFAISIPVPVGRFQSNRVDIAERLRLAIDEVLVCIPGSRKPLAS